MKRKLFFTGTLSLVLAFGLALVVAGCGGDDGGGGGGGGSDAVVTIAAIGGVTAPATGGAPVAVITETDQYIGTVSWNPPVATTFAAATTYTAKITLAPKAGYTFTGVPANFFTVAGATATNAAGSGVVTAIFPATGAAGTPITISAIGGVTAPATGGNPVATITETTQYTGTVSWNPPVAATFAASTAYTATITLALKAGYTFTGVPANFFSVAGAAAINAAGDGVVTAVFPATNAGLIITAKSTALEVVWPKFGDLDSEYDYQVRYKANAASASDVIGSTLLSSDDIAQPITGSFRADIHELTNNVTYRVWVFKESDTYTTATPFYTGTGTPVGSAKVGLSPKSHGTAGANTITGLNSAVRYIVQQNNDDLWYPIDTSGDLGIGGSLEEAIDNTVAGSATIANLSNNRTYNVFVLKAFPNDNVTLTTTDTSNKNTIVDVGALGTGKKFTITTTTGGATLIVFTNESNAHPRNEVSITTQGNENWIGSQAKPYVITEATTVSTTKIKKAPQGAKYAEIDLSPMLNGSVITFTVGW
jgi:hypothetical protein